VLFSTQEEQQQGVDEVEGLHLAVYPNPASTNTTISVSGVEGLVNVAIISLDGRTVQSYVKECPSDCQMVLDVENLAKGTYLVRVYNEKINVARKFSVQ
jgi:hypothetical protein